MAMINVNGYFTRMFSAMKITSTVQRNISLKPIIPSSVINKSSAPPPNTASILPSAEGVSTTGSLLSSRPSVPINVPTYHHILPIIGHIKDPLRDAGVVLDPAVADRVIGDPVLDVGIIGDDPDKHGPVIEARHIQKIRRWHMNRHHLKKRRKKHRMMFWRRRYAKAKRKRESLRKDIEAIQRDGEEFDALSFVQQRLERARQGGFKQNFWESEESQPEVPWPEYARIPRKWRAHEPSAEYKTLRKALIAQRDKRRTKLKQMKRRLTFKH